MTIRMGFSALGMTAMICCSASAFAADQKVKIGVLSDHTGPLADITGPGSVVAARMAAEDFGGKALGKPIEIVFADHQNKADIGAGIAARWFDVEDVDVVADVPNSSVGLAVQNIAREKNGVFLTSGGFVPDISGKACSPTSVQWTADTYALSAGTARALTKAGFDSWFFVTADYVFGNALTRDASEAVGKAGGKVVGNVRHPFNTVDLSSFLLQAQASKAKIVGLSNAGGDTIRSVKQAREFGLSTGGQRVAGLVMFVSDVHAIGLEAAQDTITTESFYWDMNDETRAWSRRFMARHNGKPPTMIQAGVYGSILHYLKAVEAAATDEAKAVSAKMRELPINDFYTKGASIREDGRVMRDFYVFSVKKPSESKYPWDYYNLLATIPAAEAARPLSESDCPLVKKAN